MERQVRKVHPGLLVSRFLNDNRRTPIKSFIPKWADTKSALWLSWSTSISTRTGTCPSIDSTTPPIHITILSPCTTSMFSGSSTSLSSTSSISPSSSMRRCCGVLYRLTHVELSPAPSSYRTFRRPRATASSCSSRNRSRRYFLVMSVLARELNGCGMVVMASRCLKAV